MELRGYKNLRVWQKAMDLVMAVYKLTNKFPKDELFGLTSQMRRAAISVPSNIAEGSKRKTSKDAGQFYHVAFGSGAELETQVEAARRLTFGDKSDLEAAEKILDEVMKMLNRLTLGRPNDY